LADSVVHDYPCDHAAKYPELSFIGPQSFYTAKARGQYSEKDLMRIVLVDTTIGGELIGGAQTFLIGLMRGLVGRGLDVHLLADGVPNDRLRDAAAESGAEVHTDVLDKFRPVEDSTPEISRWVNRLRPDIYVVSVSPDLGWTALPRLDPQIAKLAIVHSNSHGFYDPLSHYGRFITTAVGVSQEICKVFEVYCGLPKQQTTWIPYGVQAAATKPDITSSRTINLVYVGRLAEEDKRASDLIRITRALMRTGLDFSLTVIGDGPLMPEFKKELAIEIKRGKVSMCGWLQSEELLSHLKRAEVSLLVSESEGFCIALVEEMANGCCPIVTDIESGNKQLVEDGVNGFVVPVGDVGGFVDKIKVLAANRERLQEMREKAWYTGRQYSVERMVDNYVSCFERAIEDARSNPRMPDPNFPLMESCRSKYPLWLRRLKAKAKMLISN
jgi:glycosyltransferase involved in cell wall biosynthesis